jgi:hypothetical protein
VAKFVTVPKNVACDIHHGHVHVGHQVQTVPPGCSARAKIFWCARRLAGRLEREHDTRRLVLAVCHALAHAPVCIMPTFVCLFVHLLVDTNDFIF